MRRDPKSLFSYSVKCFYKEDINKKLNCTRYKTKYGLWYLHYNSQFISSF